MPDWSWWLVLVVGLAHWGSSRIAAPLERVRRRLGISTAAGAALIAMGTASPEVGTNLAAALREAKDIGQGNLLGSNIVSIPLVVGTAWLATRRERTPGQRHVVAVDVSAGAIQVLPYLCIIALVGLLTLPPTWRGLQPLDGWIMLGAYLLYLAHAALRHRSRGTDEKLPARELLLGAAGLAVLGLGPG